METAIVNPYSLTRSTPAAEDSTANKKIGVCTSCGYTWKGRSKTAAKPPRCPECDRRTCAWKDALSPAELERLAPLFHGIEAAKKPDEHPVIQMRQVIPRSPRAASAEYAPVFASANRPAYLLPAAEPERLTETAPAVIDIPGVAENIPLIPAPQNSPADHSPNNALIVAWENNNGEIEYAALVNPETLEETEALKTKIAELETAQPAVSLQDIDILKAAGYIDDPESGEDEEGEEELNENTPHSITEEDEYEEEDEEGEDEDEETDSGDAKPAKKEKKKSFGISTAGAVILIGVVGGALALTIIPPILAKKKTAKNTKAKTIHRNAFGDSVITKEPEKQNETLNSSLLRINKPMSALKR